MILDGAEIILVSKKDNFGMIKYTDGKVEQIPVKYLAIGQYENDKQFYVFLCNDKLEVEQDNVFDTLEEAQGYAFKKNKNVEWEEGIKHIKFDDIDYKGGRVNILEVFGEDMLEIYYPNGYMIDVGYIEDIEAFVISIIKDNDWMNTVEEIEAKTDTDLRRKLIEAIQWVIEKEL